MEQFSIYQIRCIENERRYIGITISYGKRMGQHTHALRAGKHSCKSLQDDFDIFGLSAFEFSIIDKTNELAKEAAIIKEYSECYNLYNKTHNPKYVEGKKKITVCYALSPSSVEFLNKLAEKRGWSRSAALEFLINKAQIEIGDSECQ